MIDGYLLNMRALDNVNDDRHRALKPLEEAAEIFGAWPVRWPERLMPKPVFGVFRGGETAVSACVDDGGDMEWMKPRSCGFRGAKAIDDDWL